MRRVMLIAVLLLAAASTLEAKRLAGAARAEREIARQTTPGVARSLRVQVLSTMLSGNPDGGIGEWGFAALIEVDGRRILFDTGARPETVLKNARELKVDLASVQDVILTHNHSDHTTGLLTLRREYAKEKKTALSIVHVGRGIFWDRPSGPNTANRMMEIKAQYEATGGSFIEYNEPKEIAPGVWLTGPVPRQHAERNWSGSGRVKTPDGLVEDTIPEDMSLVLATDKGLVLVSGCGHAGIINTLEVARRIVREKVVYAAIGGFHLFNLDDQKLDWTAGKLKEFGLRHFLGAHCTGIEAVYRLRERAGLDRQSCVVGSVGSSFSLDKGIDPLQLAR
jgi:7,8-dihydropterin-6-yl-methyl-4-(beta-D-ribofuranosyl)aminobenzene 5'-phosphate synthase